MRGATHAAGKATQFHNAFSTLCPLGACVQMRCSGAASSQQRSPPCKNWTSLALPLLQKLDMLCRASVPEPPPEWIATYALLYQGMMSYCQAQRAAWDRNGAASEFVNAHLGLNWYCGLLSRMHINSFKCVGRGVGGRMLHCSHGLL